MPTHGLPAHRRPSDLDDEWMRHGACLARTDLPWTVDAHQVDQSRREEMATACRACPVLVQCGLFAVRARVTGGFWAGAARDERPAESRRLDDIGGAA